MKITKREPFRNPLYSVSSFGIPLLFYGSMKASGVQFNTFEWVWMPVIAGGFIAWLVFNFKVIK